MSIGVDGLNLEPVFGEIQTDGRNLHGGRLLSLWRSQTTTLWHIDARERGPSTPSGLLQQYRCCTPTQAVSQHRQSCEYEKQV
jgi:hypothetical protein